MNLKAVIWDKVMRVTCWEIMRADLPVLTSASLPPGWGRASVHGALWHTMVPAAVRWQVLMLRENKFPGECDGGPPSRTAKLAEWPLQDTTKKDQSYTTVTKVEYS